MPATVGRQARTIGNSPSPRREARLSFTAKNVQDLRRSALHHVRVTEAAKLAVVLRADLETWQKLNVTAFVVSGIGRRFPELVGEPYMDASATTYLSMFVTPVLVFAGDQAAVRRAFDRAMARELPVSLFTNDLFATGNDVDNRAAVARVATFDLVLAGFAVAGDRKLVDKALDKLRLHP
jgi:hypothetical protein